MSSRSSLTPAGCRLLALLGWFLAGSAGLADPGRPRVLFLGDQGHHRPAERFAEIEPVLKARGIELTYTEGTADLNREKLRAYDCLVIYANTTELSPPEEAALLDFVSGGKGFVPLHCASYCFLNSPRYIELVGAQFLRHGTGVFRAQIAEPAHPAMLGYSGFESWDETYLHQKHNPKDRVVLEYRLEGTAREPWTWARTEGKGRVFYTAWGHDERTWGHPGFQNLLERGIRWAAGGDPSAAGPYSDGPLMTALRKDLKPFRFTEANVPFYPAGKPWGTIGEPIHRMQLPLEPEESIRHVVTPVGFEVKLFASEPEIQKPIAMNWDERGRLWIAETVDYPNDLQPPGQGHDRIKICEDTDGDGRADRFTVFADKLSLPTSLIFSHGGVIVHQPPETLFLRDNDGDGVADERRVLFSGWSTADTHAGPSNLRYGFDNWIWGMVGYSGFQGEAGGEKVSFRTGFYRFRPDGSKLEFLRNTNNNSWGVGFSEEGLSFGSTANGNPSVYLPIPNRYYESVRGWSSSVLSGIAGSPEFHPITDQVRQVDFHGHFTAAAGHALYTARAYPREYWNRAAFVNEPTGHLTATFLLEQAGSDFRSRIGWNLLASDDEWCAPIAAEVGPDGQVWVIDWYNYIVQHNPTPAGFKTGKGSAYLTDLRDKVHGRIWRVVWPGGRPSPRLSLESAGPEELVRTLKNDNLLWRLHAQRLLVERGRDDVAPALIELARDRAVDGLGLNTAAIHALWTLKGLGVLEGASPAAGEAAALALAHPSAGVRRSAALVLPRTAAAARALLQAKLLGDTDGQVRLAALLALSEMPPSSEAAEALASALSDPAAPRDHWLLDGLTCAAAANDLAFLKAFASQKRAAIPAPEVLTVLSRVAEHHARGRPAASAGSLLSSLSGSTPAGQSIAAAVIEGLLRGWPREGGPALQAEVEPSLERLFRELGPAARGRLVSLSSRWGSHALEKHAAEIAASFLSVVKTKSAADQDRLEAARQLMEFRKSDGQAAEELLRLIDPRTPPDLASGLLSAVSVSEAARTGEAVLETLPSLTPAVRPAALRILLGRTEWTRALLGAIDRGEVQAGELSTDQREALRAHPERALRAEAAKVLARGGGLPDPDRQQVLDKLLPLAERKGDPAQGKLVFRKLCTKCHLHSGEGNRIGPDLTGMAVHPKAELLTQIIDPSRSVEGNFRVYAVITKDRRVLSGLLTSESRTALELLDSDGKRSVVLREEVAELVASPKSLMPDGFEKELPADDLVNLLEFLTQRGKFLPLPLAKAATTVSTRGMFTAEEAGAERLIFPDWSPKSFEGVPFLLVDPQGGRTPNVILLNGPQGRFPPRMPRSVSLPCNAPTKAIHLLSGVSGWGYPLGQKGSISMIVRLHYQDGKTEDHPLRNGEHFADYIRPVEVPGSKLAFRLRGQQIRYLSIHPDRQATVREIELVKGADETAPVVMAVTVETL